MNHPTSRVLFINLSCGIYIQSMYLCVPSQRIMCNAKDTFNSSGGWYVEKSTKYTVDLDFRKYISKFKVGGARGRYRKGGAP